MSRTRPSLKPGGLRPWRAEVGFEKGLGRARFVTLSLYAVASFSRPSPEAFNAAHAWELKQAALAINQAVPDARATIERGAIRTMLRHDEGDARLVEQVCRRFGWLRPPKTPTPTLEEAP